MNKNVSYTDSQLWSLLKQGNQGAFALLYERNIKEMYNYGIKLTTDHTLIKDVIQDIFIDFWNRRDTLSDVQNVKVYLLTCVRYKISKTLEQNQLKNTLYFDDIIMEIEMPSVEEDETTSQRRIRLTSELNNLPEKQREILHLKYFQNLDNEQISSVVNINYQSVCNLLHRALSNLRTKVINK